MVFEEAVIDEARHVLRLPLSRSARQVHGLADLERYLSGQATLKEAMSVWQRRVRHYARRQLIWFRQTPGIQWMPIPEDERPWESAQRIRELLERADRAAGGEAQRARLRGEAAAPGQVS
jgi:tRNA dimethylallyltransferase